MVFRYESDLLRFRLTAHDMYNVFHAYVRALIVMPRPLSVSKETIIIVLYYSVQSEVAAVRKPDSPLVGSFFVQ